MDSDLQTRQLIQSITGAWRTRAIYEGVQAGLVDALGDTPRSASDCAISLGLDPDTTLRMLRALAVLGLAEQVSSDEFKSSGLGDRLRTGAPGSLRGMALLWGGRIWGSLETIGGTLRTGTPGWGNGDFSAIHSDPVKSDVFNRAMAEQSAPIAKAFASAWNFSGHGMILDLGGGYGEVLIEMLRATPGAKGVVCDMELIATGARRYLAEAGVGDRADFIGGDFFAGVPEGMDCVVLKYILHDWSDADSIRILRNCRAAMKPGATLILLERILPEKVGTADEPVVRTDLVMMPISGRERTLEEYRRMLAQCGFEAGRAEPLVDGCWAIESRAV